MLKINVCATATKQDRFLSSFGPFLLRQEMLRIWRAKVWSILKPTGFKKIVISCNTRYKHKK